MMTRICPMPLHHNLLLLLLHVQRKPRRHQHLHQFRPKRPNPRRRLNLSRTPLLLPRSPSHKHPHRNSNHPSPRLLLSDPRLEFLLHPKSHPLLAHLLLPALPKMLILAVVPTVKISHQAHLHPHPSFPKSLEITKLPPQLHAHQHRSRQHRLMAPTRLYPPKLRLSLLRQSLYLQSPHPNPLLQDQHLPSPHPQTRTAPSLLALALQLAGLQAKPCPQEIPGSVRQIWMSSRSLRGMDTQSLLATLSTNGAAQLVHLAAAPEVHLRP